MADIEVRTGQVLRIGASQSSLDQLHGFEDLRRHSKLPSVSGACSGAEEIGGSDRVAVGLAHRAGLTPRYILEQVAEDLTGHAAQSFLLGGWCRGVGVIVARCDKSRVDPWDVAKLVPGSRHGLNLTARQTALP